MNILSVLRNKIGEEEIKLLSGFLGEEEETLAKSTDLSITSMLQGLIRHIEQGPGVADIMNVIRDGGHSGDILDDLKGLFTNQDKTQLLVTIGNNINNHFFGSTSSAISDKVAEFGGIKKTSAASLFSLCSPLVLGLIGKQVKSVRMSNTELSHLIHDQKTTVQSQLPPAINTVYDNSQSAVLAPKVVEEKKSQTTKSKIEKVEKKKSSNTFGIFAWVLLASLALAAAYYSFRNKVNSQSTEAVMEQKMGTNTLDSLDNSTSSNDAFENIQNQSNDNLEAVSEVEPIETPIGKSKPVLVPTSNDEIRTIEKNTPKATVSSTFNGSTNEVKSYRNVLDQLSSSSTWTSLSSRNFKGRTAELKPSSELKSLAEFLKINGNKTLEIAGIGMSQSQEDRAYAVQGKLYELGVPLSQIPIVSGQSSSDGSVKMKMQ